MGLKEILMHFGIKEDEAEKAIKEGLPQLQANVAYYENMSDLSRMQSVEDFKDGA